MTKTIIGIFADRIDVEEAIKHLQEEGFNAQDISIVMRDKGEQEDMAKSTGTNVAEGALSGAATGTVVGGLAGLLAGTVLPGLGGLLIGGPIGAALGLTGAAATTVSGAATGAVAGGLLGALMGLGLKKEEAQQYEDRVKEGAILVAVPANTRDQDIVMDIFDNYNAQDVKVIAQQDEEYSFRRTGRDISQQDYAMGAKGGTSKRPSRKRPVKR